MKAKIKVSKNRIWIDPRRKARFAINGVVMVFDNQNKYKVRISIPGPKRSK